MPHMTETVLILLPGGWCWDREEVEARCRREGQRLLLHRAVPLDQGANKVFCKEPVVF